VNPQAILAAVPWLRRIWRLTPPQLRVPLLLIVALVGVIQFVLGRRQSDTGGTPGTSGATAVPAGAPTGPGGEQLFS
jgi:hypothetical protein